MKSAILTLLRPYSIAKTISCYYAANGEEAIVALDAFQPDLILLDVLMPGTNGIEVCRRIKALPQWQSVPIIVVTIIDTKRILKSCVKAGADDWITKPFDSIELHTRVESMLKIKKRRDDNQVISRIQTNTVNLLESTLDELRGSLTSQLSHHDLFTRVEQSARRLENLTAKFQIYMELELAASQPKGLQADDHPSLRTAVMMLDSIAQRYGRSHDLVLIIEDAEISISARYLSIILNELVDNALKFSPKETPIQISSEASEDFVSLYIHDVGQGITEEQIAQIDDSIQFERRVPTSKGVGMGLKIVKRIVNLVGGQFFIRSIAPQGTMVRVVLPIASD